MRDQMSLGVVLTGRNNYRFMKRFFVPQFARFSDVEVINIDEESTKDQRALGRAVCESAGIRYFSCDTRGMQANMRQACEYFGDRGKRFIVWFQHDCWPLHDDFFHRLNKMIETGALDDFGAIGFNGLATDVVHNHARHTRAIRTGGTPLGVLARSPLDRYSRWYSGMARGKIRRLKRPELFRRPFSAEIPAWFAAGLNIDVFCKHVAVCDKYQFFGAWDDLAYQLLRAGVHNVVLPALYIEHRPDLKAKAGLPTRSVKRARAGDPTYHGHYEHLLVWKRQWGWGWADRGEFAAVRRYAGTLIGRFYAHDSAHGPLASFDVPDGGLP